MSTTIFNFTKTAINALKPAMDTKRVYYKDTTVKGLSLLVTNTGAKSFYLIKKVNGKTEFLRIGKFPDLSVENARNKAQIKLGEIANGGNPNEQVRKRRNEMTLGELFNEYMESYSKLHKKSWKYDEREIPKFLSIWFNRRLSDITRSEVRERHKQVAKRHGMYQANRLLERLRAMYNKAIEWDWEGINPATGLKKFREKSRDRFVLPEEMPHLLNAIDQDENETIRDYLHMLLLTGARRTNTIQMQFKEINLERHEWKIPETKNGDPQIVILTPKAMEIIGKRLKLVRGQWVFPHLHDETQHLVNPCRAWKRIKLRATLGYWLATFTDRDWLQNKIKIWKQLDWVQKRMKESPTWIFEKELMEYLIDTSGKENIRVPQTLMDIHLHDLRRTLGSYQAISGSSLQIIGSSLGHKSLQATQIYARLTSQSVRESIEKATTLMYGCGG